VLCPFLHRTWDELPSKPSNETAPVVLHVWVWVRLDLFCAEGRRWFGKGPGPLPLRLGLCLGLRLGGLVAHRGWGLYCVWSCLILSCVRCSAGLGWAGERYIFFLLPPFSSPSRPPGCHFGRGPAFLHLGQLRVDITAPLERARPGVGGGLTPPLDQHPLDRCA
jgi:hypothetical protein